MRYWVAIIFCVSLSCSKRAHAVVQLSLRGGVSLVHGAAHSGWKSLSAYGGIELSELTPSMFEFGGFFDFNPLYADSGRYGGLYFYGGLIRYNLPSVLGFYLEARGGVTHGVVHADSLMALGVGIGGGLQFALSSSFFVAPHFGLRMLGAENGGATTPQRFSMDGAMRLVWRLGSVSSGGY